MANMSVIDAGCFILLLALFKSQMTLPTEAASNVNSEQQIGQQSVQSNNWLQITNHGGQ